GAGFIGSHLVDLLMERGVNVTVLDNLSAGKLENISRWLGNSRFKFIVGDLLNPSDIKKAMEDCEIVFHLAANPDVRRGFVDTKIDYEQNILATYNLLEAMRESERCKSIVFTSSSAVYGEAKKMPTPEDYGPLKPISLYGASKLACEALISGYSHLFGFKSVICRLANVIGSRSRHGVIYDFINKLRANPKTLKVLGDGTQRKSYLHVEDCVKALLVAYEKSGEHVEIYNIGSEDAVNVATIARIVIEEMNLKNVEIQYTGGVDGGRGWKGDVKEMLLDVTKIKRLGWKAELNSAEAVRRATRELISENLNRNQ
ncbi:NAD-dependent epimerase/dehydratase family protein, partial [Candidatus Bathyarchaeota archaeon]|nr:NAD-dependent epimerase/dehydratase family protein [Candidatus Bathyarchaeota archaeon]